MQDAFTETEEDLTVTARRCPDAPHASSDTTEAVPRRVLPLVACGDRAVGVENSRYQQHVVSYNPEPTRRAKLAARTASGRARLAVVGDLAGRLVVHEIGRISTYETGTRRWQTGGMGRGSGPADAKNRRPEGRRLFVRHGGLEPSTR